MIFPFSCLILAGVNMTFLSPAEFKIHEDSPQGRYFRRWRTVTIPDVMDKFEGRRGTGAKYDWMSNFDKVAAGGIGKGGHVGPFYSDGLIYETIRGVSDYLAQKPDAALAARLERWIARILPAQEPDGWLNTRVQQNCPRRRWGENGGCLVSQHDLYNLGLLVDAGLHYWRATGRTELLEAGVRAANLMVAEIGPSPRHNRVPTHSAPEEPMVELARLVRGDAALASRIGAEGRADDYLALVKFWMENRGHHCGQPVWEERAKIGDNLKWISDHTKEIYDPNDPQKRPCWGDYAMDRIPLSEYRSIEGHAVRATLMATGLATLAAEPKCAIWGDIAARLWDSMAGRKLYVTGGIGALSDYERFGGDYYLPNRAYLETCAAIGNAFFSMRMAELTGDGKYVDMIERVVYNALLTAVSAAGDRYTYQNPLESGKHTRWNWHGCPCCPPMFLKLTGALPGYVVSRDAEGVRLNIFLSGDAKVPLSDQTACFSVETDYPANGKIVVRMQADGVYAFKVRVPGWARGMENPYGLYVSHVETTPVLKVNGEIVKAPLVNGYLTAGRHWKKGDCITLSLCCDVREIRADAKVGELKGKVAYAAGPVVYAFEKGYDDPIPYFQVANRTTNTAFRVWVNEGEKNLINGLMATELPRVLRRTTKR